MERGTLQFHVVAHEDGVYVVVVLCTFASNMITCLDCSDYFAEGLAFFSWHDEPSSRGPLDCAAVTVFQLSAISSISINRDEAWKFRPHERHLPEQVYGQGERLRQEGRCIPCMRNQ